MNFEELKALHRERRDHFDEGFSTRVHRALSWLHRAEKETEDDSYYHSTCLCNDFFQFYFNLDVL